MRYGFLIPFVMAFGGAYAITARSVKPIFPGAESAPTLYVRNCASCHGKDGRAKTLKGRLNHARNLTDAEWQNRVSEERIFNSIMNGKGKMPAFGKKLSDQEIDALVAYVRGLKK